MENDNSQLISSKLDPGAKKIETIALRYIQGRWSQSHYRSAYKFLLDC